MPGDRSRSLLGVFSSAESAASAMNALRSAGCRPADLDALTDKPYPEGTFGEEIAGHRLYVFPLVGAACGFAVGVLLTIGMQLAFPMVQGGKPLLSIPPMINILFEGTLLGAILVTVLGVLFESRLPDFSGDPHDARISDGCVGVIVRRLDEHRAVQAREILRTHGALEVLAR